MNHKQLCDVNDLFSDIKYLEESLQYLQNIGEARDALRDQGEDDHCAIIIKNSYGSLSIDSENRFDQFFDFIRNNFHHELEVKQKRLALIEVKGL